MGISESELLERAILDGLYRKYRRELKMCPKSANRSEAHNCRVHDILHPSDPPVVSYTVQASDTGNTSEEFHHGRLSKRAWLLVVILTALMMSGCAAYVYRKEIGNLLEERFPKFFALTFKTETPAGTGIVEEKYIVTYVPEGYHLTKEEMNDAGMYLMWEDDEGHRITYEQSLKENIYIVLDNEYEDYTLLEAAGKIVYCRKLKREVCYIWEDGKYAIMITAPDESYNNEVLRMLESLRLKE